MFNQFRALLRLLRTKPAVHLVTHRAREAMEIGWIANLQALGTLFVKKIIANIRYDIR